MPVQLRGIIFLEQGGRGWSETYDLSQTDYTAALADLNSVCTARMALSQADVFVIDLRVSDVNVRGDSSHAPPLAATGTRSPIGGSVTIDPDLAIRVLFLGGTMHRASKYLRGVPDDKVDTATFHRRIVGPWSTDLVNWIEVVKAHCVIRSRHPGPPVTYTDATITDGIEQERISIRRAGRPFGQPAGRRRTG